MTPVQTDSLAYRGTAPLQREDIAHSQLLCVLDGTLLGIEALAVREMLPLPLITPLSEAPPQVAGVANVRGSFVPVIDVRVALGIARQAAKTSDVLVILERDGQFVALMVSEVCDVRPLRPRPLENGSQTVASGAGLIMGLAPVRDEIAQLLRIDTLIRLGQVHVSPELDVDFEVPALDAAGPRTLFEGVSPPDLEVFSARARALTGNLAIGLELDEAKGRSVAAFALGGEYFGLDLGVVREFSPLRALAPVPCSPPFIAGLMNLRGETLTLVDIAPSLGLPPTVVKIESCKVVVTMCEGLRLGLLVDEVLDILEIGEGEISSASARWNGRADSEIVRDAIFFRDKMLGIIDLPRLLHSDILNSAE